MVPIVGLIYMWRLTLNVLKIWMDEKMLLNQKEKKLKQSLIINSLNKSTTHVPRTDIHGYI